MKLKIGLIITILMLGFSTANAAVVSVYSSGNANTSTSSAIGAGAGVGVTVQSSTTTTVTTVNTNSQNGNTNTSATAASDQGTTGLVNLSVNGNDVRNMANLDLSISSAAQVQSDDDLQAYSQVLAYDDASINAISSSDNKVIVTYNRPAKLFGFIPVSVKESAEVDLNADGTGSATVHPSWWSFLASDNLQSATFASNLNSQLSSEGSLTTNASLSAAAQAKILSDIQASDTAVYSGSASAN